MAIIVMVSSISTDFICINKFCLYVSKAAPYSTKEVLSKKD